MSPRLWTPDGSETHVHENDGNTAWVLIRKDGKWCGEHQQYEHDYDTVEFTRQEGQTVKQFKRHFPEGREVSTELRLERIYVRGVPASV